MTWKPILGGAAAERALGTSLLLFEALRRSNGAQFAPGAALRAVGFAYASKQWPERNFSDVVNAELELSAARLRQEDLSVALFGGLAGVGWAFEHLVGWFLDPEEDATEEIEAKLLLELRSWRGTYDLIGGLVGVGTYALERLPRGRSEDCILAILDRLEEIGDRRNGLSWHTKPEWLSAEQRVSSPQGHWDLGLAHGAAGVICFLSAAARAGNSRLASRATALLGEATAWFAQQALLVETSFFATILRRGQVPKRTRLAWCYGDAGCLAAIVAASAINDSLVPLCNEVSRFAASRRDLTEAGVVDFGLCHGTAGLAQCFSRISQHQRAPEAIETAAYWAEQTSGAHRPDDGLGYRSFHKTTHDSPVTWEDDPSYLTGTIGIALQLLGASSAHEPNWDRMMFAGAFGIRRPTG